MKDRILKAAIMAALNEMTQSELDNMPDSYYEGSGPVFIVKHEEWLDRCRDMVQEHFNPWDVFNMDEVSPHMFSDYTLSKYLSRKGVTSIPHREYYHDKGTEQWVKDVRLLLDMMWRRIDCPSTKTRAVAEWLAKQL
jgi:hypothetical protein